MNVRPGVVRRVADGYAWVDVERQSGCGRCAENGGCGRRCESASAPSTYLVQVDAALLPGVRVDLAIGDRGPLAAALLSYGVALFALFAGVFIAVWLGGLSDPVVAAGGMAGLLVAVAWLHVSRRYQGLLPAVRILSAPVSPTVSDTLPAGKT